jgi:3-phenylpropionate/trans-cinnamate dioxygenase ferredoxin reductase component
MTATGDVTIIGGGFIGCEIAASATSVGARATLLEALDAPLIRQVGAVAAAEIEALHRRHGVDVITGGSVASVDGAEHVEEVVLSGGRRLPARNVVLGLGVVPDVAWLAGTPIAVDDGIVCTAGGRTTVPGIYAVGDAARWWHPLARDWRRVEHWTTAADQAAVVAANIAAGAPPDHDPHTLSEVPYFWSDQYDVKVQALGFLDPMADTDLIRPSGRTVVIYSQAGILTGVLGISAARSVMRLRTLIAARATRKEAVALLTSS